MVAGEFDWKMFLARGNTLSMFWTSIARTLILRLEYPVEWTRVSWIPGSFQEKYRIQENLACRMWKIGSHRDLFISWKTLIEISRWVLSADRDFTASEYFPLIEICLWTLSAVIFPKEFLLRIIKIFIIKTQSSKNFTRSARDFFFSSFKHSQIKQLVQHGCYAQLTGRLYNILCQ